MTAFEIRPARGRQGRRILPEAFEGGRRPNLLLLAFEPGGTRPVGAVALAPRGRRARPAGPRLGIRVVQEFRGRGAGRALLERALRAARRRGAQALYSWAEYADDDPACRLWERLGFNQRKTIRRYEAPVAKFQASIAPLYRRLAPRIPPGISTGSLEEAHYEAVLRMRMKLLGGRADRLRARLRGTAPKPFARDLSVVLTDEGEAIAGAILMVRDAPERAYIDAILVAPRRRGSWAAVALIHETIERHRAAGIETVRFDAHPSSRFTLRLAERVGAVVVGGTHAFYRLLDGAPPSTPPAEPAPEAIDPPDFRSAPPGSF